jgi:hypothetical protein
MLNQSALLRAKKILVQTTLKLAEEEPNESEKSRHLMTARIAGESFCKPERGRVGIEPR